MKTYKCIGYGRQSFALGKCYDFEHLIMAETKEQARIELYKTYEHITRHLTIEEVPV